MKMEKLCKKFGAPGGIIPLPSAISAGCGLAWAAKLESEAALRELMERNGINPQAVQECLV